MNINNYAGRSTKWGLFAATCLVGLLVVATPAQAQREGGDRNRGEARSGGFDQRERGGQDDRRASDDRRPRDDARSRFTHSEEGRRFDNGVTLRHSVPITDHKLDRYFPVRSYSYPHYATTRSASVIISPFGFYAGIFPPFIDRSVVILAPPPVIFVDRPGYVDGAYVYTGSRDGYYLHPRNQEDAWRNDSQLKQSVYDVEDAFRKSDITLLTDHADPNTKVAIFAKGQYEYSLNSNDYLDMTRDFMRNATTTAFDVYRVHNKTSDVYQVFAKHVYNDQDGQSQTVYLCLVLQRVSGHWVLTQVDTSPDRING